jgi:hypothetical protein
MIYSEYSKPGNIWQQNKTIGDTRTSLEKLDAGRKKG